MSSYRLGRIEVQDEQAGRLTLEGDGYAAAGELSTLLVSPEVAAFLGVPEDARGASRALADDYRRALQALYSQGEWTPPSLDARTTAARAALIAGVERLIGPARLMRMKQLSWRIRNGSALLDEDVASGLRLTEDQRQAIADAAAEAESENQRVLASITSTRGARLASHQSIAEAAAEGGRKADERLLALLTVPQRQQFEAMKRGTP